MKPACVAIVINFPSYHQVDLFNALAEAGTLEFKIFYLRQITTGRQWKRLRQIRHPHVFCPWVTVCGVYYFNPTFHSLLAAYKPEILIVTQYANLTMQLAMYERAIKKNPWVFWAEAPGVRFSEHYHFRSDRLRRWLRNMALLPLRFHPMRVWGVGRLASEQYSTLSASPAINIPYYFDTSVFAKAHLGRKSRRRKHILFAGNLIYRKGIDLVLSAADHLVRKRQDFSLHIVGDGPLRYLVENLPSHLKRVVTYEGFAEIDQMPRYYQVSDILLFPSRYDGWGMGIVEGMAAGLAVVATTSCGAAMDAIVHGENGLIISPGTVEPIVSALESMLDDPSVIQRLGNAALRTAARYDARIGASALVEGLFN